MSLQKILQKLRDSGITPKAVAYARYSSDNQNDASIDAQLRAIHDYANQNSISIIGEYIDKAKSATNADREQFQRMIRDAKNKDFDFVIVHKIDRFARNRIDSMGYQYELKQRKVILLSVIENYDTDTPEGALLMGVTESMAEFFSLNLSREIKKGQHENALKAKHNGGTPPLGYDVDPETNTLIINADEANVVKIIFDMTQERYPYNDVANFLNGKGYKTKRGSTFSKNSLHDILRNPKYTGLYFYNRIAKPILGTKVNSHKYNDPKDMTLVPGGVPAIISQEQFDDVQQILNLRKQTRAVKQQETYLFTGKIFCGKCGMAYSGNKSTNKHNGSAHITYRCGGRRKIAESKCKNISVNRDLLEAKVLQYLAEVIFDSKIIPQIVAKYEAAVKKKDETATTALRNMKKELAEIKRKSTNIMNSIESGLATNALLRRLNDLDAQEQALTEKIAIEEARSTTPTIDTKKIEALFYKAKELFKKHELDATKRLIDIFIDRITVYNDHIDVRYSLLPFFHEKDTVDIIQTIPINDVRHYKLNNC